MNYRWIARGRGDGCREGGRGGRREEREEET